MEAHVTRDYGHPWSAAKGWDLLEMRADSEEELTKAIAAAEKKFWKVWIRDNTGNTSVAMYKPAGAMRPWKDSPERGLEYVG